MITLASEANRTIEAITPSQDALWLVGVLAVLLVAMLVVAMRMRERARAPAFARADEDVFMRLCDANDLTRHQVYLLRRMYHELKLDNPLLLFLSPRLYERYEAMLTDNRLPHIKQLHEHLFS